LPPERSLDFDHVFLSRGFIQTTLPHSRPKGPIFVRENGNMRVTLVSPDENGLPYGLIPRLVLVWICTQVCYLKSRSFEFPDTFYSFLRAVGIDNSGQNARATRRHMESLFRMMLDVTYRAPEARFPPVDFGDPTTLVVASRGFRITDEYELWWDSRQHAPRLHVCLSERFFEYAQTAHIPLDWMVLRRLRSPLALDVYAWLVHRSYRTLRRHTDGKPPEFIPWRQLQLQFGSEYYDRRDFARRFRAALTQVLKHLSCARVRAEYGGLRLLPFQAHPMGRVPLE